MGNGNSVPSDGKRKKRKKSKKGEVAEEENPVLLRLEEKIAMVKQDLIRTKEMGEVEKRNQEDEIYKCEMELYEKKLQLRKRGEQAKTFLNFWEYVEVVNSVLHGEPNPFEGSNGAKSPDDMTLKEHRAYLKAQEEKDKKNNGNGNGNGTLTKHTGTFTIYSFFEAFLLRRLHIAMILKHQRTVQSETWNNVILYLFDKAPGWKERVAAVNEKYATLKPESNNTMREIQRLRKKKAKLYDRMVTSLREEADEEENMTNSLDGDKPLVDDDNDDGGGGGGGGHGATDTAGGAPTATVDTSIGAEKFSTAKFQQKGQLDAVVGGGAAAAVDDDDELSFRSRSSRRSNRSKRRTSNSSIQGSNSQAPRWMKSSRSKMSKSINRDLDSSFRSIRSNPSNGNRSPSPPPAASPLGSPANGQNGTSINSTANSKAGPITDDDIEKFLYPKKSVRKSRGGRKKDSTGSSGTSVASRRELPQELEFPDRSMGHGHRDAPSTYSDDVSSIGSGSLYTSLHSSNEPKTLTDIKSKKKELDDLIKSMETPGEDGEETATEQ